jgi:hypothetical protein
MTARLVFHIGYHKTATTWMQGLLFTPEHGFRQIARHREVFTHIVKPHGLLFDPAPMQALISEGCSRLEPGEVPVISSEVLSGHPFLGGRESETYAQRIKAIAPDARILISVRSQMRILPSVYMQYLLRGGTMTYDHFFDGTDEPGYFGFAPEHFEYDRLVARYQALFGADRVHVLTQESLRQDMEGTVTTLTGKLEARSFNGLSAAARRVYVPSYPEYAVPVLRRINHIQVSTLNPNPILSFGLAPMGLYRVAGWALRRPPFSTLLKSRTPVSDHVRERFKGRYDDSNARLAAMIPELDLSTYR